MDQTSFWTSGTAEAPAKLRMPPMASREPGRMLEFALFQGFIWGMSNKQDGDKQRHNASNCRVLVRARQPKRKGRELSIIACVMHEVIIGRAKIDLVTDTIRHSADTKD
jgi:hypothetical protein